MKTKLALIALLLPTAVFAQAGKSGENPGYQSTTGATQGLGSSNPNAGAPQSQTVKRGNPGYQGTTSATQGLGASNSNVIVPQNPEGNNPNGPNPGAVRR